MSRISHSSSMMADSAVNNDPQQVQRKKKIQFEDELRDYKPKENTKASSAYDPMMEKLKQWKKERDMKQQSPAVSNPSGDSRINSNSKIKQMKGRPFENSLRSYSKSSLSPISKGKSRLESSLLQFYGRLNQSGNKNMMGSSYLPGNFNRSTIFSVSGKSQSHKKGFFSETNSVCPSIDKNNLDFIDQIEDRIEDLYYDFMDGKMNDRQQMRKEIIEILHMCKIKIIKGLMIGGIEQIKLNQQLWYIFLLNFDFKSQWKINALAFLKENNIMQQEHLTFAEENIKIIPDEQNKSSKDIKIEESDNFFQVEQTHVEDINQKLEQDDNADSLNVKQEQEQDLIDLKQHTIQGIKEEHKDHQMIDENKNNYTQSLIESKQQQLNVDENQQNFLVKNENTMLEEVNTNNNQIKSEHESQLKDLLLIQDEHQQQTNNNQRTVEINEEIDGLKKEELKDSLIHSVIKNRSSLKIIEMEEEIEKEKQNYISSQDIFKKFEFLQAEIAHSQSKAQRIIASGSNKNQIIDENKSDFQDIMNQLNLNIKVPSQVSKNTMSLEERKKSITRKLDFTSTLDNENPVFDYSCRKDQSLSIQIDNNQIPRRKSIFDNESIPNHLTNSQLKQKENMAEFSFGFYTLAPQGLETNQSYLLTHQQPQTNQEQNLKHQIQFEEIPHHKSENIAFDDKKENTDLLSQQPIIPLSNSVSNNSQTDQQVAPQQQRESYLFKEIHQNKDQKSNNSSQIKSLIREASADKKDTKNKQSQKNSFIRDKENISLIGQDDISQIYTSYPQQSVKDSAINKQLQSVNKQKTKIRDSNHFKNLFQNDKEKLFAYLMEDEEQINGLPISNIINNKDSDCQNILNNHSISQNQSNSGVLKEQENLSSNKVRDYRTRDSIHLMKIFQTEKEQYVAKLKQDEEEEELNQDQFISKRIRNEDGDCENIFCKRTISNISHEEQTPPMPNEQETITEVQQHLTETNIIEQKEFSFDRHNIDFDSEQQKHSPFAIPQEQVGNDGDQIITSNFSCLKKNPICSDDNLREEPIAQNQLNNQHQPASNQLKNNESNYIQEQEQNKQIQQINEQQNQPNIFNLPQPNYINMFNTNQSQLSIDSSLINYQEMQLTNSNQTMVNNNQTMTNNNQTMVNENNNITNSSLIQITNTPSKRQSLVRKRFTASKMRRVYLLSPTFTPVSQYKSIQETNEILIQSLTQSKRKSLLGLDIKDIINIQVSDNCGSQYVQLALNNNSATKQEEQDQDQEEEKRQENVDQYPMWVRRSLRISKKKEFSSAKKQSLTNFTPSQSSGQKKSNQSQSREDGSNQQSPSLKKKSIKAFNKSSSSKSSKSSK